MFFHNPSQCDNSKLKRFGYKGANYHLSAKILKCATNCRNIKFFVNFDILANFDIFANLGNFQRVGKFWLSSKFWRLRSLYPVGFNCFKKRWFICVFVVFVFQVELMTGDDAEDEEVEDSSTEGQHLFPSFSSLFSGGHSLGHTRSFYPDFTAPPRSFNTEPSFHHR